MYEAFVYVSSPLIAHPKASMLMKPRKGPFDDPSKRPKATAMLCVSACQNWLNALGSQAIAVRLRVVAAIALNSLWTELTSAARSFDRWYRVDQFVQLRDVVKVGCG